MKENCCCFTGHRAIEGEAAAKASEELEKLLPKLIGRGITTFYSGGALGFDTLAAAAVINLKALFPELKLILALPCREHTRKWSDADVSMFNKISARADETVCVSENYHTGCMHERNRYMVERSSVCVCWLTGTSGGTYQTVKSAEKAGLEVINLAGEECRQVKFDF